MLNIYVPRYICRVCPIDALQGLQLDLKWITEAISSIRIIIFALLAIAQHPLENQNCLLGNDENDPKEEFWMMRKKFFLFNGILWLAS